MLEEKKQFLQLQINVRWVRNHSSNCDALKTFPTDEIFFKKKNKRKKNKVPYINIYFQLYDVIRITNSYVSKYLKFPFIVDKKPKTYTINK